MLFRPNTTCTVYRPEGEMDIYGEKTFDTGTTTPCAVVSYDLSRMKSTVRADSSGSRGRGEELVGVARFLFPSSVTMERGNKVYKDSFWLEVTEIHPRYSVAGNLDHWEVDMEKTTKEDGS